VVTATRHVHTEAFLPPINPPRKPYAVLGCCRRQQQQQQRRQQQQQEHQQQHLPKYRRLSREQEGAGDSGGLSFHFRLRWGPGPRGNGRQDRLFVAQAGTPHVRTACEPGCGWLCFPRQHLRPPPPKLSYRRRPLFVYRGVANAAECLWNGYRPPRMSSMAPGLYFRSKQSPQKSHRWRYASVGIRKKRTTIRLG